MVPRHSHALVRGMQAPHPRPAPTAVHVQVPPPASQVPRASQSLVTPAQALRRTVSV